MPDSQHAGKSVLLIEQGFLKSRAGKPIHGVELFRLFLIRQMIQLGVDVTVLCEQSWKPILEERLEGALPEIITTPSLRGVVATGIPAALFVKKPKPRYDAVMFGDPGRGLLPAMRIAKWRRLARRYFVMSHRQPKDEVCRAMDKMNLDVLAVSEFVASRYRRNNYSRKLDIYYGIANAPDFYPPTTPRPSNGLCHFVMVARLPNISKRLDWALQAFQSLPDDVRRHSRLHLASFIEPTDLGIEGVICHPWLPADRIPELLRQMDVMLAISRRETFSQAIVQGMLTALPIISGDHPVYVEKMDVVGGGGGIVCSDAAAVRDAMITLASDPALRARMGAIGRETALARYAWDTDRFLTQYLFRGV